MEDEVANVTSAEVDTERDTGIRVSNILVPEWNLDRVKVLACDSRRLLGSIQSKYSATQLQKMQLMEVEYVVLARSDFDGPLPGCNLGGTMSGAALRSESMFWLPFHSHEKLRFVPIWSKKRVRSDEMRAPIRGRKKRPTGENWAIARTCGRCAAFIIDLIIERTRSRQLDRR